jgi:hypothetical protein
LFACCQQLLQRDARTRGRPSLGDVCSHHTFKTAAIRALPLFHTQMHTLSECYLFFYISHPKCPNYFTWCGWHDGVRINRDHVSV